MRQGWGLDPSTKKHRPGPLDIRLGVRVPHRHRRPLHERGHARPCASRSWSSSTSWDCCSDTLAPAQGTVGVGEHEARQRVGLLAVGPRRAATTGVVVHADVDRVGQQERPLPIGAAGRGSRGGRGGRGGGLPPLAGADPNRVRPRLADAPSVCDRGLPRMAGSQAAVTAAREAVQATAWDGG
jgi:hypothetical protein